MEYEPIETITMIDPETSEEINQSLIRWEKKTTLSQLKALTEAKTCQ